MVGRLAAHHPHTLAAQHRRLVQKPFPMVEFDADAMPQNDGRRITRADRFVNPGIDLVSKAWIGRSETQPVLARTGDLDRLRTADLRWHPIRPEQGNRIVDRGAENRFHIRGFDPTLFDQRHIFEQQKAKQGAGIVVVVARLLSLGFQIGPRRRTSFSATEEDCLPRLIDPLRPGPPFCRPGQDHVQAPHLPRSELQAQIRAKKFAVKLGHLRRRPEARGGKEEVFQRGNGQPIEPAPRGDHTDRPGDKTTNNVLHPTRNPPSS